MESDKAESGQMDGPHSATEEKPCSMNSTGCWRCCTSLSIWLNRQEACEEYVTIQS